MVKTVFVECRANYDKQRAEHMQPVGETVFVVGEAEAPDSSGGPTIAGIVSHADMILGDAVEDVLAAHDAASGSRFRGIRHVTGWDASDEIHNSHSRPFEQMMGTGEFRAGVRKLAAMGFSFDAWLFHPQLPEVAALAAAVPELTIVLNHLGAPMGIGPYRHDRDGARADWQASMRRVAACPNVVLKVGGIGDGHVLRHGLVGIAGVTGSGREEVAGMLFGAVGRGGTITLDGAELPSLRPVESLRRGMAFVPADRLSKAAFLDMALRVNLTISKLGPVYGPLGVRKGVERSQAREWLNKLDVIPKAPEVRLMSLSGGNQQKVVLARVLRLEPRVLVLDEPTQGVDVGAKAAIHQIVRDAARGGTAAIVASTESEELIEIYDRIVVLVGGAQLADHPVSTLSANQLTELTMRKPGGGDDEAIHHVLGL